MHTLGTRRCIREDFLEEVRFRGQLRRREGMESVLSGREAAAQAVETGDKLKHGPFRFK